MNILSIISFCFFVDFSLQIQQIVLNLKGNSHCFCIFPNNLSLLFGEFEIHACQARWQPCQHTSFMSSHLKIIVFSWKLALQFLNIVPQNIPTLSNMQIYHFLSVDLWNLNDIFSTVFSTFDKIEQRGVVHEISSIETYIDTVNQMNTRLISSDRTWILNIITNKCAIVYDFTECRNIEHFFFFMAIEFCDQHTQNRSPSLSSSIK